MYTETLISEERAIKETMEEQLKSGCWKSLKEKIEAKTAETNDSSTNDILQTHLRRYLSDTVSYKKTVYWECLCNNMNYDFLFSRNGLRSMAEYDLRDKQVIEARQRFMVKFTGTQ